ncbi:MAG: (Fe-S)-binding protein [Thermodesulfobacteriota bacterium]
MRRRSVVTYHDSCHLLRELGVKDAPRELISSVKGPVVQEMPLHDLCCGFGGTFSIKFPKVSVSMLDEKLDSIITRRHGRIVRHGVPHEHKRAPGRRGIPAKVMHLAELLANTGKG